MESEDGLKLVVGLINGRSRTLEADDYDVDEFAGYLRVFKGDLQIGMFRLNQVTYWYLED